MARVNLQPTFVLHARPFRDTSLLLDLFTLHHGRISAIARGAKSSKSKVRGLLLPFVPLLVSWSGKTDLVTTTKIEPAATSYNLPGNNLLSGLYINELLVRLLHRHDPHPNVYNAYQNALIQLQNKDNVQAALRIFEKILLAEIGYGLQLHKDNQGNEIIADADYYYDHGVGFVGADRGAHPVFPGSSLLALANNNLTNATILKNAKRLMRLVFGHLLNDKPLKSRDFFDPHS